MENPKPTDEELCARIDRAFDKFRGNSETLKSAIGYAFIARRVGWKPALLMHTQKTVKEYDKILDIDSRSFFDEIGPDAHRSHAWRLAEKVTNFWKAVKGEIKGIRSTYLE
jgi:hypothetical protein